MLLDEPTNHLDLRAKDVLLDAIRNFTGTVLFVSHDRYFIDGLATRVFEVEDRRVHVYPGNYEDYLWRKQGGPEKVAASLTAPPARANRRTVRPRPFRSRLPSASTPSSLSSSKIALPRSKPNSPPWTPGSKPPKPTSATSPPPPKPSAPPPSSTPSAKPAPTSSPSGKRSRWRWRSKLAAV